VGRFGSFARIFMPAINLLEETLTKVGFTRKQGMGAILAEQFA
jgi:hypothetical protein